MWTPAKAWKHETGARGYSKLLQVSEMSIWDKSARLLGFELSKGISRSRHGTVLGLETLAGPWRGDLVTRSGQCSSLGSPSNLRNLRKNEGFEFWCVECSSLGSPSNLRNLRNVKETQGLFILGCGRFAAAERQGRADTKALERKVSRRPTRRTWEISRILRLRIHL